MTQFFSIKIYLKLEIQQKLFPDFIRTITQDFYLLEMNTENNSSVNHKYNTMQALPIPLSKYEDLQTETQCMLISDQKHGQVGIENKKLNFH